VFFYPGNPIVTYSDIRGGWPEGIENINTTPLFIDPDGPDDILGNEDDDYHLQSWSPCIDAGDPDPQYNDPDGTRNDMGAYGGPEALP